MYAEEEEYYTAPASVQPGDISDNEYRYFERKLEKINSMKGRPKQSPILPTPEQKEWLLNNYKLYNRYHLVKHLGIPDKRLTEWFKRLGLNKRDGKQITLTKEQKAFVCDNYLGMSKEEIAVKLGVAVLTVQRYCNRNQLIRLKQIPPKAPVKEIIRFEPPPKPTRPRADHTNMTREQRIDYWLNYPI